MHCDAAVSASESYIGLVEVGVGLIPGGGGTKEFALRVSDGFYEGDVQMPMLIDHFKSIATAAVSTSASEALIFIIFWKTVTPFSTTFKEILVWLKRKYWSLPKTIYPLPQEKTLKYWEDLDWGCSTRPLTNTVWVNSCRSTMK